MKAIEKALDDALAAVVIGFMYGAMVAAPYVLGFLIVTALIRVATGR